LPLATGFVVSGLFSHQLPFSGN